MLMKSVFSFENHKIRTSGDFENPLFVATDICIALGHSNPRKAVADLVESENIVKSPVATNGGTQIMNCVNESGLYELAFGSRVESAKRFKKWVVTEVLPQIRRTGRYECPLANSATNDAKINETEQYEIQEAIRKRAKNCSVHYQTIYHALYDKFKIPSYKDLHRDQLSAALTFIEMVQLSPQIEAPKTQVPDGYYLVSRNTMLAMQSIIHLMTLNMNNLNRVCEGLRLLGCTYSTATLYSFLRETLVPRKIIEQTLTRNGFDYESISKEELVLKA